MRIAIIGLGYVGLPLAVEIARHFECWGVDIDPVRIAELERGHDRTREVAADRLRDSALKLAPAMDAVPACDVYIVTVPTPIHASRRPDLGPLKAATAMVAGHIDPARKPIIVYESTVYPGVTEDICGRLITEATGLARGRDFFLGYSPERINPGDREHTVDRIVKVVAGEDEATTGTLAGIYGAVTSAGVFRAASIKTAEAAKVIENAQRDINIAFMNEIAQIFAKLDISVWEVLDAARTKWNFLPFQPGLVGGHCIGVDPYYLSHRAAELGHVPEVILAGRSINDGMGAWLADQVHSRAPAARRILVLGLTFKENVPDLRNSKVADVIARLRWLGHETVVHDPLADPDEVRRIYGVDLAADALGQSYDAVLGCVPHDAYAGLDAATLQGLVKPGGLIADPKRMWRETLGGKAVSYWTL